MGAAYPAGASRSAGRRGRRTIPGAALERLPRLTRLVPFGVLARRGRRLAPFSSHHKRADRLYLLPYDPRRSTSRRPGVTPRLRPVKPGLHVGLLPPGRLWRQYLDPIDPSAPPPGVLPLAVHLAPILARGEPCARPARPLSRCRRHRATRSTGRVIQDEGVAWLHVRPRVRPPMHAAKDWPLVDHADGGDLLKSVFLAHVGTLADSIKTRNIRALEKLSTELDLMCSFDGVLDIQKSVEGVYIT